MLQYRFIFLLFMLCVHTDSSAALSDQLTGKSQHQMIDAINDFVPNVLQSAQVIKSHFNHKTASVILSILYGTDPNPMNRSDLVQYELVCFLVTEAFQNKENMDFAILYIFTPDATVDQSRGPLAIYTDPCDRHLRLESRWLEKNMPRPYWAAYPSKTQVIHAQKKHNLISLSHTKPGSLLSWVIQHNFPDLVNILIRAGTDARMRFVHQLPWPTPLHEAATYGFLSIAKILVKHTCSQSRGRLGALSTPDRNGDTPLHYAARKANLYLKRQKQLDEQLRENERIFMEETGQAFETICANIMNFVSCTREQANDFKKIVIDQIQELPCAWPRKKILPTDRVHLGPEQSWPIYTQHPHTNNWHIEYIHKGHFDVALMLIAAGAPTTFENHRRETPNVGELIKLLEPYKSSNKRWLVLGIDKQYPNCP